MAKSYSATNCFLQCCFQKDRCLHSTDPVFKPSCGRERLGGNLCEKHPDIVPPPPQPLPKPDFEWVGTSDRVPTNLDFKGTYENDVRVLCAVCMSNLRVRIGMEPLEISDWARARFNELTSVGWKPPGADSRNEMIRLGYLKEDSP